MVLSKEEYKKRAVALAGLLGHIEALESIATLLDLPSSTAAPAAAASPVLPSQAAQDEHQRLEQDISQLAQRAKKGKGPSNTEASEIAKQIQLLQQRVNVLGIAQTEKDKLMRKREEIDSYFPGPSSN